MSNDSNFVKDAAIKIMAGLLSNPNIVAYDHNCGFSLVNCTPATLGDYAWYIARELERSQNFTKEPKQ